LRCKGVSEDVLAVIEEPEFYDNRKEEIACKTFGTRSVKHPKIERMEMEIKHGRAAMLGFLHIILIEAGARFPGYISPSAGLKFADVPAGCFASLEALPTAGWLQIMLTTCMMETGYFLFEYEGYPNVGEKAPGDIGGESWVRYDDAETKAFKLNVERQNGRAAMLGVTGCLIHELLGVDALYPTGGLGGAAPPTIF